MPTFYFQWKLKDAARADIFNFFGSLDEEAFAALRGEGVEQIGRWHDPGNGSGWGIATAPSSKALLKWFYNWSEEAADIFATPVLDDDSARRVILAKAGAPACTWQSDKYDAHGEAKEGESLYVITWKAFTGEAKNATFKAFSEMTQEQDVQDSGPLRVIGRWHNLGDGSGVAVVGATNMEDVYTWGVGWGKLLDFQIHPCITDADAQDIVRSKPGHAQRLKAAQVRMGI